MKYLFLVIPLLMTSVSVSAALNTPACADIESWVQNLDPGDNVQITPRVSLNALALDASVESLFGQTIWAWGREDFRAFNQQMNVCRKEASRRRARDVTQKINLARKYVGGAQRAVLQVSNARTNGEKAVQSLVGLDDSPELEQVLDVAIATLQGNADRQAMSRVPRNAENSLFQLLRVQNELPSKDAQPLVERLEARKAKLLANLESERNAAMEQLAVAKREVDALPIAEESFAALDRYAQLPVLSQVPPADATAFGVLVHEKRQAIRTALQQERDAKAQVMAAEMVEKINAFKFSKPADLGRFWELGTEMGNQLRGSGSRTAGRDMNQAFWQRLGAAAKELLPEFTEQLEEIPVTTEGAKLATTAVADLTGISRQMPIMKPYYAAAQKRGLTIAGELRQRACNEILDTAGVSSGDAEQSLWGAGKPTTLGEFFCSVAERGSKIHEYDDAGLLSDEHTIKLTTKRQGFHTLKLHEGEVQPGQKMLIGFEITDANQKRNLTVKDWEQYVAQLTGKAGGKADCERLMRIPRSELSVQDSMDLMGCVLQAIPMNR